MLYLYLRTVEEYRDDVEPHLKLHLFTAKIGIGCTNQMVLFVMVYGPPWLNQAARLAGFDLCEDKRLFVLCHYIHFKVTVAPIAADNAVTPFAEERTGILLACSASLHVWRWFWRIHSAKILKREGANHLARLLAPFSCYCNCLRMPLSGRAVAFVAVTSDSSRSVHYSCSELPLRSCQTEPVRWG